MTEDRTKFPHSEWDSDPEPRTVSTNFCGEERDCTCLREIGERICVPDPLGFGQEETRAVEKEDDQYTIDQAEKDRDHPSPG